jgi:subtilisin family serine protease
MAPGQLEPLVQGLDKAERRAEVARILTDFSAREQADLVRLLSANGAQNVTPLWIVNAVCCEASAELIRLVAVRPDVEYVGYDMAYAPDVLETPGVPAAPDDEIPWGVRRINAPAVWAQGHTGQGIVVGVIDTGCDYAHPDLADHLWADPHYPHHGWDFENNDNNPMDDNGHGTNTAGFVAADGTAGSQCGAAPDAQLMICRVRAMVDSVSESQCWQAMQFCVAPPLSPGNGADLYVLTLGWLLSWNPHLATWRTAMNNVAAAGLSQIVSPGSEGSGSPPRNLRCPGNVPPPWWNPENTGVGTLSGAVAVGATDSLDNLASFSSQGPVSWAAVAPFSDYPWPPGLTKPEFVAPGVGVKTIQRGGGYVTMSGTSWSAALAGGAAALLLSADSSLSPAAVDSMLEITAIDCGPTGKDNAYGAGRIDVLAAVTGVEEGRPTPHALRSTPEPSIVRNIIYLPVSPSRRVSSPVLLDAAGCRIMSLQPGPNDVSSLRPGVYFLRHAGGTARVTLVR